MDGDSLLCSIEGPVATLTLNRPTAGNAITAAMMHALLRHLGELKRREDVRVVVLTGAGKYFCTGMDVRGAADLGGMKPHTAFDALWKFPKPVVAKMNGPARGGGVGLLLCCDIRVASSDAHIALPEVALGVYPALISAFVVPQLGICRSQHLMLTGEKLPSSEFVKSGVASDVVAPASLNDATNAVVQKLLKNSLFAQAGVKRLVQLVAYGGDEEHDDVMGLLSGEFRNMMSSPERAFAAKFFMENRRPPDWSNYYNQAATKSSESRRTSKL